MQSPDAPVDHRGTDDEPPVHLALLVLLVAAVIGLYGPTLIRLWSDWMTDDNYAHGVLVLPFVAWLLWRKRSELRHLDRQPSSAGALIVAAGLGVLLVGQAAFELFLTRISLLGVVAGGVVQLYGWRHLRAVLFPLALVALAIPLPALIFNEIAFPMQLLASRFGVAILDLLNIPAVREGNIILLDRVTLEVAEACSGVRSLISLGTLALVYGYLGHQTMAARVAVALAVLPVVIVSNALRVAGAGAVAHQWGPESAVGFLHSFSGWLFFGASVVMLIVIERGVSAIGWFGPPPPPAEGPA